MQVLVRLRRLWATGAMLLLAVMACWTLADWPAADAKDTGLAGVQVTADKPTWSLAAFWRGEYQMRFTQWFGLANPMLHLAVAVRNQVYFSLLRQSATPSVVVGRHLQLYEAPYLTEYCSRDPAAFAATAEDWAGKLAAMQRWYAKRGRVFVYVITPSKAATYPGDMPQGWPCPASQAQREGLMPAWREILTRHRVSFVDGPAIEGAKRDYPFRLFPRGGTHWNWVGATLVLQNLLDRINFDAPGSVPAIAFTWKPSPPTFTDRDLTDLLNLPFPRLDYATPVVVIQTLAPGACPAPHIAQVGGSFVLHFNLLLQDMPCPSAIDYYSYFRREHFEFPGAIRSRVDEQQQAAALLDGTGIVILEENEQYVFRSEHGHALWQLLAPRIEAEG